LFFTKTKKENEKMHPGLFAVCMFAIALVLNLVVSFFINLCASKGNREKKSEDLITITHGVKDYGVKEINIKE
jgi:site-specific recombinase